MDGVTASETNGLVIVSITRHKYWHATVDGRAARLIPVNLQYQGLVVPTGRHTIRMEYRNPLLFAGGVVSLGTVLLLLVLLMREGHDVRKEIVEPSLELDPRVDQMMRGRFEVRPPR